MIFINIKMDYSKYNDILEPIPKKENTNDLDQYSLFKYILKFLQERKIENVLISLSGGVDSMVLCIICKQIKLIEKNFNFYCVHLNYNNRDETVKEEQFLIEWCKYHEINLDVLSIDHIKRGEGNRNDYEEETRNIRYNFYKESIDKYNCSGVILAHHKDDYSENVFNNIMRGQNSINNLGVFKEENILHDVKVLRPMLSFKKDVIYEISVNFEIPYFLDTTPKWSCRGQMRNEIFPKCNNCYGEVFMTNLHKIGKQSEDIDNVLKKFVIGPILDNVYFGKFGFMIPIKEELKQQIVFENVIDSITFKLMLKTVKRKVIKNIIENIKNNCTNELHFVSGYKCFLIENSIFCIKLDEIIDIIKLIKKHSNSDGYNYIIVNDLEKNLLNGILFFKSKKNKLKIVCNNLISKYVPTINGINLNDNHIAKLNINLEN